MMHSRTSAMSKHIQAIHCIRLDDLTRHRPCRFRDIYFIIYQIHDSLNSFKSIENNASSSSQDILTIRSKRIPSLVNSFIERVLVLIEIAASRGSFKTVAANMTVADAASKA